MPLCRPVPPPCCWPTLLGVWANFPGRSHEVPALEEIDRRAHAMLAFRNVPGPGGLRSLDLAKERLDLTGNVNREGRLEVALRVRDESHRELDLPALPGRDRVVDQPLRLLDVHADLFRTEEHGLDLVD